jgi:hypothetical protein
MYAECQQGALSRFVATSRETANDRQAVITHDKKAHRYTRIYCLGHRVVTRTRFGVAGSREGQVARAASRLLLFAVGGAAAPVVAGCGWVHTAYKCGYVVFTQRVACGEGEGGLDQTRNP